MQIFEPSARLENGREPRASSALRPASLDFQPFLMPVTTWSERVLTVDTCVEALDAAAVGYTWGAEQRALESMHLKLAAHVAVLDTPGLEALKRDMNGRLKSVNRRPYSPAEDRAVIRERFRRFAPLHAHGHECDAALQAVASRPRGSAQFSPTELAEARHRAAETKRQAKEAAAARARRLAEEKAEAAQRLRQQREADRPAARQGREVYELQKQRLIDEARRRREAQGSTSSDVPK